MRTGMKKLSACLAGACVIVALACLGYWLFSQGATREFGFQTGAQAFEMENGAVVVYRFRKTAQTKIHTELAKAGAGKMSPGAPAGAPTEMAAVVTGDLSLKFYRSGKDGWDVAARILAPTISINGKIPGYAQDLTRPFAFHLSRRGLVSDFSVPAGTYEKTQAVMTGLIYHMQTVLPEQGRSVWRSVERNRNGCFEADYEIVSASATEETIRKKIRGYVDLSDRFQGLPVFDNIEITVQKAETIATVSPRTWIVSLTSDEEIALTVGGRDFTQTTSRIEVKAMGNNNLVDFPKTFSAFEAIIHARTYVEQEFTRTDPTLDPLGENLNINEALAAYERFLKAGDRGTAETFLVNYLRQHKSMAAQLLSILNGDPEQNRFDEKTQLVLWRLVVQAGYPEAQRAVIDAAMDPSYGRGSHIRGLLYVIDFENPQPFLLQALWALHRSPELNGDPEISAQVENMSLLAIGSLGYRDKLNEDVKEQVATQLLDNLTKSDEHTAEVVLTLKAIGNTGNDSLLPGVSPYFEDNDESVRAAACDAVRRMGTPAAQEKLISLYRSEASSKVRERALKALYQMPTTSETAAWTREDILQTNDVKEQVRMVEILGKTLSKYPSNEKTMHELLAENPPLPVKETIYRFIAPK